MPLRDQPDADQGAGNAHQPHSGNAYRRRPHAVRLRRGRSVLRQAVILVGGLGTRLGERTKTTPKPMLPVGGRPFLDTLIDEIARYDAFDEILLLAGHKAGSIL